MRFSTSIAAALSLATYASAFGLIAIHSGSEVQYSALSLTSDSYDVVLGKGTAINATLTSDGKVEVASGTSYYLDVTANNKLSYSPDGEGSSITGWSIVNDHLTLNGKENAIALKNDDGSYNVYWYESDAPSGSIGIALRVVE